MKVSYFESVRYVAPQDLPPQWPLPPGLYEPEVGEQVFQSVLDRVAYIEELGFDWVSVSEHHYSARILSPSPIVMASHLAAHLSTLKIAVLGPIMPLNNPVRVVCGSHPRMPYSPSNTASSSLKFRVSGTRRPTSARNRWRSSPRP